MLIIIITACPAAGRFQDSKPSQIVLPSLMGTDSVDDFDRPHRFLYIYMWSADLYKVVEVVSLWVHGQSARVPIMTMCVYVNSIVSALLLV